MPPDEEHITHEAVITKSGGGGKDLNWDKWKHIKKKKQKNKKNCQETLSLAKNNVIISVYKGAIVLRIQEIIYLMFSKLVKQISHL